MKLPKPELIEKTKTIDASGAACILGVSRRMIYSFIANGDLDAQRLGLRQWLIEKSSVLGLKKKRDEEKK